MEVIEFLDDIIDFGSMWCSRDDEDVVRHECRARDSRVIGVAESPFFLVVLRVTYYVHEIAKPNMHELKHSTVQFRVQWCNNS